MLRISQRVATRAAFAPGKLGLRLATSSSQSKSNAHPEVATPGEKRVEQNALKTSQEHQSTKKSLSQMDDEMRRAMEGLAGDGGEAGLELEDGKAVSMKRGVRENMFRYI